MWRMGEDGPSLVAFKDENKSPRGEGLLEDMKSPALALWEGFQGGPSAGWSALKGEAEAKDGLATAPVWTSNGLWGAVVYGVGGENETVFVESVAIALGLAAEREILHEEVGMLRGRIAAAERDKAPSDRYMAIGQLAAHSYNELEAILDAVGKSLRRETQAGELKSVGECLSELQRARDIVGEQLELARLELPVLKMADLNVLIQASMADLDDRIHTKGIRLMKRLSTDIPRLLLDAEKVKIAVRKVLGTAAARSVPEGWLRVETALQDGDVVLQVTWEEKASPGDGCDDMFVPFGPLDRGGMGLIVASQIIREHGGGVRVQRFESGSSALILDFPVQSNQDRRHKTSRRRGFDRRRFAER